MCIRDRAYTRMSQALDDRIALLAPALFHHLGADGVYARTALFERVIEGLTNLVSRYRDPSAEVMRFPPVMSRSQLEKTDYQNNFPQLLGGVCCLHLHGSTEPSAPGGDWAAAASTSDLVVTPAACYPVYPLVAARGAVPEKGLMFDVSADCSGASPRASLTGCSRFVCGNSCAWDRRSRRLASAANGSNAPMSWPDCSV